MKIRISQTQKRKRLYRKVAGSDMFRVGLVRYGWLRRWYWLSHHQKAVRVKDMDKEHLTNTIRAMQLRHPEDDISPLLKEWKRRRKLDR